VFNFLKNNKAGGGAILVFDIGGTKMRVAVSRDGKTFDEPKIVQTPKNFEEGMAAFRKLVNEAAGESALRVLCGGVPGVLNRDGATIFDLPNLPGWNGKPIKAELEKMFGVPVYLENDSVLVGLGEAVAGAGKGHNIVAYMTVSTGVGGARIVGGRIDEKVFGFEPGWQIINFADLAKNEDSGYLGRYVSGSAVQDRFGKHPAEIKEQSVLEELSSELAVGLHNAVLFWSPDIVVLGGSMITGVNPIPLDKVELKLRGLLTMFPEAPMIKKAVLGDFGGLYGSLELVRQRLGS
jgi:glucokinase